MNVLEIIKEANEIGSATKIYVDMDGVLADFFTEWGKLMGKDDWRDIGQENIPAALEKIKQTENFWLDLPLTSNAKSLLNLIKDIKGSYTILSSPLPGDPNSEPHKLEWIKNNLSFFPPEEILIRHDKETFATQEDGTPNILIDDYGVNIQKWEAAGGVGFKHKDHKFERTAQNIKQHMQEPVEEVAPATAPLPELRPKNFDQIVARYKNKKPSALVELLKKFAPDILILIAAAIGLAHLSFLQKFFIKQGINFSQKQMQRAMAQAESIEENFADGKVSGRSRPGRVARAGASCNGSVSELRKKASNSSGERAKMYHWCANMKAGRQ